jgi:hypothetical protein
MRAIRKRELEQELRDSSTRLRAWHHWHREQLDGALCGPHREKLLELVTFLKNGMARQSAPKLIALIRSQDWRGVDADTRFVALHEIDSAITRVRAQTGLPVFDDALPHQPSNGFLIIRALLRDGDGEALPDAPSGKTDER